MPRVAIIASLATNVVPFQLVPENHLKYIMKKSLLNKSLSSLHLLSVGTLIWVTPYWWNSWCNWTIAYHVHVRYTTTICNLERRKWFNVYQKQVGKDQLTHLHFDEIYNAISKTNLRLIKRVEGSPRTYSLQVNRQVD